MNILILGYGLEGKSAENYFKSDPNLSEHTKIDILDNFTPEDLQSRDFSNYDLIFRTPSVRPDLIPAPKEKITSVTKFFFSNCKAKIIGVTGTKGKGTTCTLIRDILVKLEKSFRAAKENSRDFEGVHERTQSMAGVTRIALRSARLNDGKIPTEFSQAKKGFSNVFLLGNIGAPALDALPTITENDVVIYELSSFQLWDLEKSPSVAVALRIEPDHLDVHKDFEEYLSAKENITRYQSESDSLVYFKDNKNTFTLASLSKAKKFPYPLEEKSPLLNEALSSLKIPGAHNKENAEAALLACAAFLNLDLETFLTENFSEVSSALANFKPLPHHIEFVRELNSVKYYDDSFSTVLPSLEAAIKSFPKTPLVLIAGGKDKGVDVEPVKRLIFDNPYLIKAVLIGETAEKLSKNEDPEKFYLAGTDFDDAVKKARSFAETYLTRAEENSDTCLVDAKKPIVSPVVLLSPCASSFDMFKSYKDRGDIFKTLVKNLKEN